MNSNGIYAKPKRRKPVQKSVKPTLAGVKSNPSKRHRDRLNGELERLASLLPFPQDVISKLDKLTVLRLSVSYLRAKSFFSGESGFDPDIQYHIGVPNEVSTKLALGSSDSSGSRWREEELLEGELLLKVLNGFLLVVTADGTIFYASPGIKDYLGFHQSDVIHQSAYELIHTEDRSEFQKQLHWALKSNLGPDSTCRSSALPLTYNPQRLPPENSTFLKRNFVCRLRCVLDNSSGFLAVNVQGCLKCLHGQNQRAEDGSPAPPQLALFALATPLQVPSILEIRTRNFFFRTKHKLDFTPIACDDRGKHILGYTDAELCDRGSGYQFIHAADMLHCAENHVRMIKTGDSGLTVFRLLNKQNQWLWIQANARLIYKNGKPDYIIASQKILTDEEGEENLRKRNLMLPFHFPTGEAVLYDTSLSKFLGEAPLGGRASSESDSSLLRSTESLDPSSPLGAMMKQDDSIYVCVPAQNQSSFSYDGLTDNTEDLGSIFPSYLQDSRMTISENTSSEPNRGPTEDLCGFMESLGVCKEDLELFQRDEDFLKVDTQRNSDMTDLLDEALAFVGESLVKQPDCVLSSVPQKTSFTQTAACLTQRQKPHSPSHQNRRDPFPDLQQQMPAQLRCPQAPDLSVGWWREGARRAQHPPYEPCQIQQQHGCEHAHALTLGDYLQGDGSNQQQLCHRLTHLQVSREHAALAQPFGVGTASRHPPSSLFQSDQPDPSLYGHLTLDTDGLNPSSNGHIQGICLDLFPARLPDFPSLNEQLGGPEPGHFGGKAGVSDGAASTYPCLSPAQPSSLGENSAPPHAHLQFQGSGDMDTFFQESSTLAIFPPTRQPLLQHPGMSSLYPDLALGGFARSVRPWLS